MVGATDLLGPDTHISLGVAIGVVSVLVGAAFTIARQVQRWEDCMKGHGEALVKLETKLEELHKSLNELPCGEVDCATVKIPAAPRFKAPRP